MTPRLPRLPGDLGSLLEALDVADLVRRTPRRTAWTDDEATVLEALADAGGDLTAHRTVHLEDR